MIAWLEHFSRIIRKSSVLGAKGDDPQTCVCEKRGKELPEDISL